MGIWKDYLEIRKENKRKRFMIKSIKSYRKDQISDWKKSLDDDINNAKTDTTKTATENEKKELIKKKNSPNKKGYIVNLKKVNKYFVTGLNIEHVLKDIDLNIQKGKVITILGQSGSGKTTLLNIISGLLTPETGSVVVNDKELMLMDETELTQFRKDTLSFVFQSYNLIPTLTVRENIKVGENLRSKHAKEIPMKEILSTLDLTYQAKKYPYQLSGGQNQRISIGRALAKNPKILFADEPTGALDEEKGREVLSMLMKINTKFKTTIIIVTHNSNIAKLGDMVIYLKDGKIHKQTYNKTRKPVSQIRWL